VNRWLRAAVIVTVALVAGSAGYYFNRLDSSSKLAATAANSLVRAPLYSLDGKPQTLLQYQGNVLVINFWATWCAPCREEIPALKKIQSKHAANGVKIVGIALDNASKVKEYAQEMNIGYALLIGGAETLSIGKDLGNQAGVLPFTLVLDRTGTVAFTHTGALTESALGAVLRPLL
jgi:thiol-disulfide isomerase/thioredoxin